MIFFFLGLAAISKITLNNLFHKHEALLHMNRRTMEMNALNS